MHRILMLSSSRMADEPYLQHAQPLIASHLAEIDTQKAPVVFVPYAGVTVSNDDYTNKVKAALPSIQIKGIHNFENPKLAISKASAVMVGGGNTFRLLQLLYQNELIEVIQQRVNAGMPYIGWSAGSNICGMTIGTTNDMPIIEPPSFKSLGFIDCQINPHYTDYMPPNHNGETRDQRIAEFTTLNPDTPVIGIREGSALLKKGPQLTLAGELDGVIFINDKKLTLSAGQSLDAFLPNFRAC